MPDEFPVPTQPRHDAVFKAYLILNYAHDSCESLLGTFDGVRRARKAKGTPTDEEQDLLRSMVVFSGAGIDSMAKQLIRDALPVLVEHDFETRERVESLVARWLGRGDSDAAPVAINVKGLASLLLHEKPRDAVVDRIVKELTSGSLQSVSELYRIASYFGVEGADLGSRVDLKAVFDCRNKVIHELDIDFAQPNRNRYSRRRADMVKHTRTLLSCGKQLLRHVDARLASVT